MHADMTTVTIQYNKIVFNAVKDNEALLQLSFGEKTNKPFSPGVPNPQATDQATQSKR